MNSRSIILKDFIPKKYEFVFTNKLDQKLPYYIKEMIFSYLSAIDKMTFSTIFRREIKVFSLLEYQDDSEDDTTGGARAADEYEDLTKGGADYYEDDFTLDFKDDKDFKDDFEDDLYDEKEYEIFEYS